MFFLSLCLGAACVQADPVERDAPPIYAEKLEPELTKLDPLLDQVGYFTPEESDHGCVLQETIVYIDAEGRTYELFHHAFKALSNGDLDDVGSDLFTYRPETDKIYLIRAETILPNGSVRPVPSEGIMIQAHQDEQSSMIFSGRKQLRVIYPQVSEGSVTHCIVLVEHETSRIPGQYLDRFTWERSWQTHLKRTVVNLPEAYAKRLNIVSLGANVPTPEITKQDEGRTRYEWVRKKLPVRNWEYLGGPVVQTGPTLFLSTLRDWNELAEWYAARIRESSEASDAVKAVAREWAGDAQTEDQIIYNLAFRVANDIRYVSLEFGVGGLQPQPVDNVLENRFGDCKDKANFLRVLLQELGIKSYVALVNTKHAGHVEKRSADYNYFNHAILLIEKSNGDQVFCDPTVKYGSAGVLYPSIANRPALVIDDESSTCRWVQTPQASAGSLDYAFDVKLSRTGELSGWMTMKAKGYYATSLSRRFEATDRESLKNDMERYVGYFYDASSVIDFELERSTPDKQEFSLKTYFIRPATGQAKLSVSWPSIKWLLPRLGEEKDVQREAFVWNDASTVSLKITLPDGMVPVGKPDDWSVQSPGFSATGKWSEQEQCLAAEFHADVSRSHIPPPEFPKLFNAVDATSHWLEKIVILGPGAGAVSAQPAETPAGRLGDAFVLMSTGKGQVDLVDHLYPSDKKPEERKLALEKTISWFPKDAQTQFDCKMRLGWLAYDKGSYEESLVIAREAYRDYKDAVNTSSQGWARYLEAMALEEVGKVEESRKLFCELEANPDMNVYRRGYSAYQYARMMSEVEPDTATAYYLKALRYETYDEQWMLQNSYAFLLQHMSAENLTQFLEELHGVEPERAKSIATWLGGGGVDNKEQRNGLVEAAKIHEILSALSFAENELDGDLLAQLAGLHHDLQGCTQGREALGQYLAANSYELLKEEPDQERSYDEYAKDIDQAIDDDDIELCARLALWRILHLEPEVEFPKWVWDASRMVDYLYKHDHRDLEPLVSFIFDMRQYLPPKASGTIDLQFIQSESLEREGHIDEALAVYQSLHDQALDKEWWDALYSRWTALLTSSGRVDKAVEVYSIVLSHLKEDVDYLPICIQGVYVLLENGDTDKALAWIHEIHQVCGEQAWENENVEHINQWVALEEAGKLQDFWTLDETWAASWTKAQVAAGLPSNVVAHLATFSEMVDAGREIGEAIAQKEVSTVSEKMQQMLIGARWHPYICLESQAMMPVMATHYPAAEEDFYQCAIDMNSEAFQLNPTNRYSCRVGALEALLKLGRYEGLMDLAEGYWNDPVTEDDKGIYGRYGALGAVNLNRTGTAWLERIERQMDDPEIRTDPYAVNILSLLYRQEGKATEEQELLQRFVSDYTGDNDQMLYMLKTRQTKFQAQLESNKKLTQALTEWGEQHGPVWLPFFPDPEIGQEDVADVSQKVKDFCDQNDRLKYKDGVYLWHAALDDRLDTATREDAFYEFLGLTMDMPWHSRAQLDRLNAVAGDERFSGHMREQCAHFAVSLALSLHMHGYLEESLLPNLDGLQVYDKIAGNKDSLVTVCNLDGFSAQAISEWMDSIGTSSKPVDYRTAFLLGTCFNDLCSLDALDLARQQISNVRKLRFDASSNGSSFTMQLKWQQSLDRVAEMMPLHEVMQDFFMEELKPDGDKPQYIDAKFSRIVDLEKRRALNRTLLKYELYDHTSLDFWRELNDSEYLNGKICVDAGNLGPLLEKLLAACGTDQQYSMALYLIRQLFDSDDVQCKEIFSAKTAELAHRPGLRVTHETLLWNNYQQRIRSGDHERLVADLRSERNLPKSEQHALMMEVLLVSEDQSALGDYLNTASPDLLLEDGNIGDTMLAYKVCGRDSGFELFRDRGREVLDEYMARSVLSGDRGSLYHALQLAELLENGDRLTDDWVEQVKLTAQKDDFAYLQMRLGAMREDWPSTEKAARTLAKYAPLHYDTFFYLGKALISQKKYEEGIEAIAPFLRYCKDSRNYREAQKITEEAKSNI